MFSTGFFAVWNIYLHWTEDICNILLRVSPTTYQSHVLTDRSTTGEFFSFTSCLWSISTSVNISSLFFSKYLNRKFHHFELLQVIIFIYLWPYSRFTIIEWCWFMRTIFWQSAFNSYHCCKFWKYFAFNHKLYIFSRALLFVRQLYAGTCSYLSNLFK